MDQQLSYESGTMEQWLLGLKSYIFEINNLETYWGQKNPINKSPRGCFDYSKASMQLDGEPALWGSTIQNVDDLREFPIPSASGTFTLYRSAGWSFM